MTGLCTDLSILPTRGPCSKYHINIAEGEFKGKIEIKFEGDPFKVSVTSTLYSLEASHQLHTAGHSCESGLSSLQPPPQLH